MNIINFLRKALGAAAKTGASGNESSWFHLCKFTLRGRQLQMVELRIVGGKHEEDSVAIPAAPGAYSVECRTMSYGSDRRISRMRVYPTGASTTVGRELGTVDVDWGGIAITDVDVLAPSVNDHMDEYSRWFDQDVFGKHDEPAGVLRWIPAGTDIPYADGGFGDGTYPVYELVNNEMAIGLEVVFISPDEKYPF